MTRILVLGSIVLTAVLAVAVSAQQPAPAPGGAGQGRGGGRGFTFPPVTAPEKVADNLYMIPGQGGNTAAWVMASGVLLVDTKLVNNGQAILDQLRTVTDKPVTHIVNTHSHPDHNGSNAFFPPAVEIVVQENGIPRVQAQFKDARQGIPDRGFRDRLTLFSGSERVELHHYGRAHTDNDTFVVFPAARVMHTGDAFASKAPPFIDRDSGGSGVAFPATLAAVAKNVSGVDRIIPGHAALMTWQDFLDWGEYNQLFLDHARASLKAGQPAEEAARSFAPGAKFSGYGPVAGGRGGAAGNFGVLYGELKTP